jgi:hypothetical protein
MRNRQTMYKLIKDLGGTQPGKGRNVSVLRLAQAVLWSFFGVRRMGDLDADAVSLAPLHIISAGLLGTVILVLSLITLVRYILA